MRVFVTGGTGQIGSRLVPALTKRGDEVVVLTRHRPQAREKLGPAPEIVEGDPLQLGTWAEQVNGCDAVVNLVGEGVFNRRWKDAFKQTLRDSRIKSTENVVAAIRRAEQKPHVLVQGSAIGYYGFHGDEILTEASPPGDDFLAKLCIDWENAAKSAEADGLRVVLLRTGVVLDKRGGALKKMITPFKWFVGGKVGSGKQWVSWVHHEDEVGIILIALDNDDIRGPINSTSPVPVRNKELSKALARALHRPCIFPVPGFMLRLFYGKGRAELITKGQWVLSQKAQLHGYQFKFPEINAAMKDVIAEPKETVPT